MADSVTRVAYIDIRAVTRDGEIGEAVIVEVRHHGVAGILSYRKILHDFWRVPRFYDNYTDEILWIIYKQLIRRAITVDVKDSTWGTLSASSKHFDLWFLEGAIPVAQQHGHPPTGGNLDVEIAIAIEIQGSQSI